MSGDGWALVFGGIGCLAVLGLRFWLEWRMWSPTALERSRRYREEMRRRIPTPPPHY